MTGKRRRAPYQQYASTARVLAALFIVLIVLPFTAPFQTVDLDALHAHSPVHRALTADKVASKDISDSPTSLLSTFTAPHAPIRTPTFRTVLTDNRPFAVALRV